jgi:hypothetical protein
MPLALTDSQLKIVTTIAAGLAPEKRSAFLERLAAQLTQIRRPNDRDVETSRGWRIAKEKAAHKIDVVVALAMAAYWAMRRRWDEEVPIVMPFFAGTPRNIPGQNQGVGTNWWPLP